MSARPRRAWDACCAKCHRGSVKTIDLETANRIIATAIRIAHQHGHLPLTYCVVDRGGHLVSAL